MLSGRVTASPHEILAAEILQPQFAYESEHLLGWYVAIEQVLALEYQRMGLLSADETHLVGAALAGITTGTLTADRDRNLADIAFAVERHVAAALPRPVPRWHVDRSRNDLQACAQVMFGRQQLADTAESVLALAEAAHRLAAAHVDVPMPGYTHSQAAQVVTPGFYFSALVEETLRAAGRLLTTYDEIDRCPLGAGAMAGQELPWDRDRAAALLGFADAQPHALVAVAARDWQLRATGELACLGVVLSRFVTDLITWSSSAYGFVELPDEYAGISSAMPQKKNYPLLERIRGRTGHLAALHMDTLSGQRNTAYTNSVEVSKEAGTHVLLAFQTARSALDLATVVLDNLTLRTDRMRAACARDYLGGFTLANLLTLDEELPWRQAQVVAGGYILAATKQGLTPEQLRPELLAEVARSHGFELAHPERALNTAFDVTAGVDRKRSTGSTHPDAVRLLLDDQAARHRAAADAWQQRRARVTAALAEVHRLTTSGGSDVPRE